MEAGPSAASWLPLGMGALSRSMGLVPHVTQEEEGGADPGRKVLSIAWLFLAFLHLSPSPRTACWVLGKLSRKDDSIAI